MDEDLDLKRWTIDYVKHKDLILGAIQEIREQKDSFIVKYLDKEVLFLIVPELKDLNQILVLDKEKNLSLVMLNTKSNFNIIVRNWKKLSEYKNLKLMFVNPNSSLEKKWIVSPHFHSKISDDSALRTGLKTMFETVEEYK